MHLRLKLATVLLFASASIATLRAQTTIHIPADQPTIQAGIDAAHNGDTVLVAPRTYYENIDFKGKAITVISSAGAATTIINGSNLAPTVIFQTHETRSSVISGFTITNGAATQIAGYDEPDGGIAVYFTSPTILNNIITANYAHGIRVSSGAPLIQGNTISNTLLDTTPHSLEQGGGIFLETGSNLCSTQPSRTNCPDIVANTIIGNLVANITDATGITIDGYSSVFIERNIVSGNTSGGISTINTDSVYILNNLVYSNSYGGIKLQPPYFTVGPFSGIIANNIIVDNSSSLGNPQVDIDGNVSLFLFVNNIIVGNANNIPVSCTAPFSGTTPSSFDHNDLYVPSGPISSGCDIPTGLYGNISVDPQFTNAAANNYSLLSTSPLIDSGNSSAPLLPNDDLAGNPRFGNAGTSSGFSVVDIGAYEYGQSSAIAIPQQTTLTVTPSAYIQTSSPIQLTAQLASVLGIPTGDITFLVDNQPLGTVTADANGVATIFTYNIPTGTHAITATYAPTGQFSLTQSVKFYIQINTKISAPPTTTTSLLSSLNPSAVGQNVAFTATVTSTSGTPSGTLAFTIDGLPYGSKPAPTGIASISTSSLLTGTHTVVATFTPTGAFVGSTGQLTQTVLSAYPTTISLTSSLNPSTINDTVTFTAHIASANGIPTGSVAFTEGAVQLAFRPLDSTGLATFPTSALPRGQHIITATYVPTGAFAPAATILTQTVNGYDTTSTLAPLPSSINAGTTLTFSAKVAPKLSTSPGAPSGVVTFLLDGSSIGSVPMNVTTGTATLTSPTLTSGLHTLTCYYEGDLTFNPSTCAPLSFTASTLPTTLTLASPASPIYALNTIPFVANLNSTGTPVANAPITITLGSTGISSIGCSGTTNTAGTLACSTNTPNFLPGTQAFSAIYNGDNTHAAARTPSTITIVPNPTTPSLTTSASTAPQGGDLAITLHATTATTAFTPDGTLTLLDGITPIGSVTLPATTSGTGTIAATLHLTTLSVGPHTLSVAYQPSTSSFIANAAAGSVTVTITPSSFTLSSDPAALSIQTQHHASVTLNLTSIGAFANSVYLSCNTPLPPVLKCEFARTQVALTAGGTASTTLKLETDAVDNFYAANTAHSPRTQRSREVPALCGCFFAMLFALPLATRRRRKALTLSLAALAILSLASITGCSGQYPDHTPPGTYDILVTGTGNNITKTTHLTLTITP